MKYDDASWHSGGDFPEDLPPEAGATHIAFFFVWCVLNELGGEEHQAPKALTDRLVTPGAYFLRECDGKLIDEDLSPMGNHFARWYYESEQMSQYLTDYLAALDPDEALPSLYYVPDTWEKFDRLAPLISKSFHHWERDDDPVDYKEVFKTLCASIASQLAPQGYKYAKSGPHVSRKMQGFNCVIEFFADSSCKTFGLLLEVKSLKFKKSLQAFGAPNPTTGLIIGGCEYLFQSEETIEWSVDHEGTEASVMTFIAEKVEPIFSHFENLEDAIQFAAEMNLPGWRIMDRLHFLMCFSDVATTRKCAVRFMEGHKAVWHDYNKCYENYKGQGLVQYVGGYAEELAHASHVFGLGNLLDELPAWEA